MGYCTMVFNTIHYKLGQALWARSNFGEQRLEGLCINFLICCLLSVCNIFTTPTAAYHRPKLERAHKAWPMVCGCRGSKNVTYRQQTTDMKVNTETPLSAVTSERRLEGSLYSLSYLLFVVCMLHFYYPYSRIP